MLHNNFDVNCLITKECFDLYKQDLANGNPESLKELENLKLINRSFYGAFHQVQSPEYKNIVRANIRTHMMECLNKLALVFAEKHFNSVDQLKLFKEEVASILEKKFPIGKNIGIDLRGIEKNSNMDAVRATLEVFSLHVNKYAVDTIEFKNEINNSEMCAQALMQCKNLSQLQDLTLPIEGMSLTRLNELSDFLYGSLKESKVLHSINFLHNRNNIGLYFNAIDDDYTRFTGVEMLVRLAHENQSLKSLSLQALNPDSINRLFRALNDCPIDLNRLDLSYADIYQAEGNELLCKVIRNCDLSIREINLSFSGAAMSELEAQQLADAIQVNTSIQKLDLTDWDIPKAGKAILRSAMDANPNIKILGVDQPVYGGVIDVI